MAPIPTLRKDRLETPKESIDFARRIIAVGAELLVELRMAAVADGGNALI